MNSGKFAKLAGVTPRTLRHYRNIGLLRNVRRKDNGYYEYTMSDLLTMLRIRSLTSLGFSLDNVRDILEETSSENGFYLDDLDKELEKQIDRLKQQREAISLLKEAGVSADTPACFIRVTESILKSGIPADMIQIELESLLITYHLLDADSLNTLYEYFGSLIDAGLFEEYCRLGAKVCECDENTPESEKDALAEKIAPIIAAVPGFHDVMADSYGDPALIKRLNSVLRMHYGEKVYAAGEDVFHRVLKLLTDKY